MKHGSLFSGIGGFDLAAEWMGWENVFHCEWNPFGQKVLHHYWPNAEQFTDITKTDFTKYANTIDILTGGFPCQPYSMAGKRLGKEDDRHLWPEMLRAIREIQPKWIVGENVLGLVNWNGGLVFDEVQADLEAQGYEVQPYVLPAVSVNAPHRRDRVWFVAYRKTNRFTQSEGINQWQECEQDNRSELRTTLDSDGSICNASDSDCNGFQQCNCQYEKHTSKGMINALCDTCKSNGNGNASDSNSRGLERSKEIGWNSLNAEWESKFGNASNTSSSRWENRIHGRDKNGEWQTGKFGNLHKKQNSRWKNFPTVSPLCNGDDGLSSRLDSITFPKWRAESIKAGGNAVVPQVVHQIFKAIQEYERLH